MKVVIPTTGSGADFLVFSTPQDDYEVLDRDIWDEETSGKPLWGPIMILVILHTCGQQVLPKVENFSIFTCFLSLKMPKFSTLINTCWPQVYNMTKIIIAPPKGPSEPASPSISSSKTQ